MCDEDRDETACVVANEEEVKSLFDVLREKDVNTMTTEELKQFANLAKFRVGALTNLLESERKHKELLIRNFEERNNKQLKMLSANLSLIKSSINNACATTNLVMDNIERKVTE